MHDTPLVLVCLGAIAVQGLLAALDPAHNNPVTASHAFVLEGLSPK